LHGILTGRKEYDNIDTVTIYRKQLIMTARRKNASIRDVAEKAGVSIAAVSRTLNKKDSEVSEKIRNRVLEACKELDYQINPSIQDLVRKGRNGHTRNIAFIMVKNEFADPAYSRALDGIAKGINDVNYNLAMARISGDEKSVQELPPVLRDGRIDGFIVTGTLTEDMMEILKKLGKPYVILGNYSEKVSGDSVRIELNHKSAMFSLVSELKKAGKNKIAYFAENPQNSFETELMESFTKAMRENQLTLNEKLIYSGTGIFSGAFERLKPMFLQKTLPFDSIICLDFRCAQEIANLILIRSELGKGSETLLATSRQYSYYKLLIPAIYCEVCLNDMAYRAVKCLVEMIAKGESYPHKIELTPAISVGK
jgi:DNA-binding LacI/PurR family transcriptional regulator